MSVRSLELADIIRRLMPEALIFVDTAGGVHCTNREVPS